MSVTSRPLSHGYLGRVVGGELVDIFPFQYNPTIVTRARSVEYNFSSPPGSPIPFAQFKSISSDRITLELLLDAVEIYDEDKQGVGAQKAFLESLTQPDIDSYSVDLGQFIPPPVAKFSLGRESFDVVATGVQFRDVRWNRRMICTRSRAQIQLATYWVSAANLGTWLSNLETLRQKVTVTPSEYQGSSGG
jgi:hypothetical protein